MPDRSSYLIRKRTVLIGNTSFRTETYKTDVGVINEVKVKDIFPSPSKEEPSDGS
jgi:hypothetical protein